jgi:YVTN family beta-propeller protein
MAVSPAGTMLVAGAHGTEKELYYASVTPSSIGTMNTINVENGGGARAILYGKNGKVYVANYSGNSLSVLNASGATLTLAKVVPTSDISPSATQPRALALTGNTLFVACSGSNEVLVFDTTSETFTKSIQVGNRPFNLEFNLNESELFVANFGANSISVIDLTKQETIQTLTVGIAPAATRLNESGTLLFVSNYCDKSLCAVDISEAPYQVIPGSIDLGQTNGNPIDITTYDDSGGYTNVFVAKEYFKARNDACAKDASDPELDMSIVSIARALGAVPRDRQNQNTNSNTDRC